MILLWFRTLLVQLVLFVILLCNAVYVFKYHQDVEKMELLELLKTAKNDLSALEKRYNDAIQNSTKCVPTSDYLLLTRKIVSNVQEFSTYLTSEITVLKGIPNLDNKVSSNLDKIMTMGLEYKRALMNNMKKLVEVDGFENWRKNEINDLSNIVQERLTYLQNPTDCHHAKKLVCSINYGCGFGCQMHHLMTCLIVAYGTQRTLILKSKGWQYNKNGWDDIFMPLSDTCVSVKGAVNWPGNNDSQAIEISTATHIKPRPKYIPIAVPEDLVQRLVPIHGNPAAWWVGQMLKYIWKTSRGTTEYMKMQTDLMNITGPYVGLHVRRTDKIGREAKFTDITEYMDKVNEYYNENESETITTRRVYIATDDISVINEAKSKYPQYEIMYNQNIPTKPVKDLLHRHDKILDVLMDIHLLSQSKFLVCTFSSNICRLVYELMQKDYVDASKICVSLDFFYIYVPQMNTNKYKATLRHNAQGEDEIDLLPGDIINYINNHWNGFSSGKNLRTKKQGLYPTFKADMQTEIVDFPTYAEVKNTT